MVGGTTIRGVPFIVVVLPTEGEAGGLSPAVVVGAAPISSLRVGGGDEGVGIGGVYPGGEIVETVLDVRSPPMALWITSASGTSQPLYTGRIDGPAGRQDVRSGYRDT